jgi:hypothetical protein
MRGHPRSLSDALERYARRLPGYGSPVAPPGHDFSRNELHVDEEVVCPKCLRWITPHDIVRRTVYGLAQHEACPRLPA